MSDGPFTSDSLDEDGRLVLRGDLDEGATVQLRSLLEKYAASGAPTLRIDLSDVELLPSAAVGVLAKARDDARKAGRDLEFVAAEGSIAARVLTICSLPYTEA